MHIVTGGAGFIGSHLAQRLVSEGKEVVVIDNLFSGNKANLALVKGKIKFVKGNAGQIAKVGGKPEAIFHQGIYSSSPMYRDNPLLVAAAIEDMLGVLEFARKSDCRVVFASSSSLYNGITPPHREDAAILVTDYYTEARYAMERLAELYSKLHGMRITGLRYFSVYGENEFYKGKYANLISQFLWQMQKGESPLIYGDGEQTRDFTYVSDIVEANLLADAAGKSGMFNAGTGREISVNGMVGVLNSKLGTGIKPSYKENTIKNYVAHTRADTSKSKHELGFSAKVPLEQGIEKLIAHYSKKKGPA